MSQNPHESAEQASAFGNLLAGLPITAPATELFETLAGVTAGVEIQRIVSFGHASEADFWYDQAQAEWVMLMQGEAILQFEGRPDLHLHAGDYCTIPAHQRHRVAWTTPAQPTVWLAVFF
jgi:cupin 2 domain-containing protein